ncbi:MAG: glycoside hydrolase family 3 N-terminal domain-containing protein [Candidatus Neomarinimicrobiota bacterium]
MMNGIIKDKHRQRLAFILTWVLIGFIMDCQDKSPTKHEEEIVYLNPKCSVEERTEDLLARMTLAEKIGQMAQAERGAIQPESDIRDYGIGSILSGGGSSPSPNTPDAWADMVDRFQLYACSTRLKIPMLYGIDAVHGNNNIYGAVIFPHNIGMGCTRNPQLVRSAAEATAEEVSGVGIRWTFAPCIATVRDERWGRTYEGFSETPELTQLMASAAVLGFQGDELSPPPSVLACAKHFLGDGGTQNGHDQGNTVVDESGLRRLFLPGYISAISADVGSIMVSFSSWNGVKMHGNSYLLTTVLKDELGFNGFLVSDWGGIDQLSGDFASDIETSVNAGLDMIMIPNRYKEFIATTTELVSQSRISQERIDDAVRRILRAKFRLGLFEYPFAERGLTATIGSQAHRDIARRAVRQSLVLLKNENHVLPVSENVKRIHVAGKNADNLGNQCGGWTISWQGMSGNITVGTTILEGIRRRAGNDIQVTYNDNGLGAEGADIAIAVIGETPYAEGVGDRTDLMLSQEDISTVLNLKSTGVPTVVILVSGRPMILENVELAGDAILAAWLPGTECDGVADVLFGDYTPVGKLSCSWPKSMSQVPINYGDAPYEPLFEYGFGLTY